MQKDTKVLQKAAETFAERIVRALDRIDTMNARVKRIEAKVDALIIGGAGGASAQDALNKIAELEKADTAAIDEALKPKG